MTRRSQRAGALCGCTKKANENKSHAPREVKHGHRNATTAPNGEGENIKVDT